MLNRAEQKLATRRKLIDAALRLGAERGFGAVSLREVAKEAEITPTAFYRHFHDMEELSLALVDELGLSLRQLLRDARKNFDGSGSAVRVSVESFVRYVSENPNLFRLLQGERQGASSAFRKALFAEIGRFVEEMTDDLDRISIALKQPLRNPSLAAETIVAVAFTMGGEAIEMPRHRRPELVERIIQAVKIILRGSLLPVSNRKRKTP